MRELSACRREPADPNAPAPATTAVHHRDPNLLQQMERPVARSPAPIATMVNARDHSLAAKRLSCR